MADNKLLLKRGSDEDFLAEDDPLAELARIVGFEPAPVAKLAPIPRREPVFDLEDELLKELEAVEHILKPAAPPPSLAAWAAARSPARAAAARPPRAAPRAWSSFPRGPFGWASAKRQTARPTT